MTSVRGRRVRNVDPACRNPPPSSQLPTFQPAPHAVHQLVRLVAARDGAGLHEAPTHVRLQPLQDGHEHLRTYVGKCGARSHELCCALLLETTTND